MPLGRYDETLNTKCAEVSSDSLWAIGTVNSDGLHYESDKIATWRRWGERAGWWLYELTRRLEDLVRTKHIERLSGVSLQSLAVLWSSVFWMLFGLGVIVAPVLLGPRPPVTYFGTIGFVFLAIGIFIAGLALGDLRGHASEVLTAAAIAFMLLTIGAYTAPAPSWLATVVAPLLAIPTLAVLCATAMAFTQRWSVGIALGLVSVTLILYTTSRLLQMQPASVIATIVFAVTSMVTISLTGYELSSGAVDMRTFGPPPTDRQKSRREKLEHRLALSVGLAEIMVSVVAIVVHISAK